MVNEWLYTPAHTHSSTQCMHTTCTCTIVSRASAHSRVSAHAVQNHEICLSTHGCLPGTLRYVHVGGVTHTHIQIIPQNIFINFWHWVFRMQGTVGYALSRWNYHYPPNLIRMCNHIHFGDLNSQCHRCTGINFKLVNFKAYGNYFKLGWLYYSHQYDTDLECPLDDWVAHSLWLHCLTSLTILITASGESKTAQSHLTTFTNPRACMT